MLGLRGLRKQGICLRFIEIEVALYDLMQGCALTSEMLPSISAACTSSAAAASR